MKIQKSTRKILLQLIKSGNLSVSSLAKSCQLSRVCVSNEMQRMCDTGIVCKNENTRKYFLSPDIAFSVLKLYQEHAEMLCFSLDGSLYQRQPLDFLYSLSYDGNVTFVANQIQKHRPKALSKFSRLMCGIIYDIPVDFARLVSRDFSSKYHRADLIATHFSSFENDTVLYINSSKYLSVLCNRGNVLGKPSTAFDGADALDHLFSIFKPDMVAFEGDEHQKIEETCIKNKINSIFIGEYPLYSDEYEMVLKMLLETNK